MEEYFALLEPQSSNEDTGDVCQQRAEEAGPSLCVNCDSILRCEASGVLVCEECGILAGRVLDQQLESRNYGSGDNRGGDPNRVGMPFNRFLPISSHGSVVLGRHKQSYQMRMISKFHHWNMMPYQERALYNVFEMLKRVAAQHNISQCIIDEAKVLYQKVSKETMTRGINRESLIASCVYTAMKCQNMPIKPEDIGKMFQLTRSEVTKGNKIFQKLLSQVERNDDERTITFSQASDYVERHLNSVQCPKQIYEKMTDICQFVCQRTDSLGIATAHNPASISASSIYVTYDLFRIPLTLKDISQKLEMSLVTVQECVKKMKNHTKKLYPPELLSMLDEASSNE